MGRSIHTNFYARFSCESIKVAVVKNATSAKLLGVENYSPMFRYGQGEDHVNEVKE